YPGGEELLHRLTVAKSGNALLFLTQRLRQHPYGLVSRLRIQALPATVVQHETRLPATIRSLTNVPFTVTPSCAHLQPCLLQLGDPFHQLLQRLHRNPSGASNLDAEQLFPHHEVIHPCAAEAQCSSRLPNSQQQFHWRSKGICLTCVTHRWSSST